MYTVVKDAITRLTVASALFITLIISSVARAHQTCGQEDLVRCAQPLQVITDTGLTFVASKKDLDIICPDLREGLRCVHSYTRRCMSLQQRSHFNKLFHGTNSMVKELCSNGSYQDEYLKYAPCMRQVVKQNEVCFQKYQKAMEKINHSTTTEEPVKTAPHNHSESEVESQDHRVREVCCSFQEYVECSTHTMRRACGEEAARFSKGFLDKMSSSMIKMHCSAYTHGSAKCPNYYSNATTASTSSYLTLLALAALTSIINITRQR